MAAFREHTGTLAVLNQDNVDTDRIIPARFLTMVTRSGYGELLFKDVRGVGCPLDDPAAKGATVLVVGTNFGCGSSREHAVWALQQAGFRAIVAKRTPSAPGYSDIFRQNAENCGLLLIEVAEAHHEVLIEIGSGASVTIDLEAQTIRVDGTSLVFEIDPVTKRAMLEGRDLIGRTLVAEAEIDAYERRMPLYVSPGGSPRL
ncbi:MAG: 3-isopropylmalate dehydratase small subunit [Fimbriimonadaceae bacterium]|nr:3-isopropylmalate dehydratase small subunit [Fimbriimonadaceae bacterium]